MRTNSLMELMVGADIRMLTIVVADDDASYSIVKLRDYVKKPEWDRPGVLVMEMTGVNGKAKYFLPPFPTVIEAAKAGFIDPVGWPTIHRN